MKSLTRILTAVILLCLPIGVSAQGALEFKPPHPDPVPLTPSQMCDKGEKAYNRGNYTEAVKWFRKAADKRYARGQYWLGFMYENGCGVGKDQDKAIKWYRKAADQGDEKAKSALERLLKKDQPSGSSASQQLTSSQMYDKGEEAYNRKDYAEAVKWWRKAAD